MKFLETNRVSFILLFVLSTILALPFLLICFFAIKLLCRIRASKNAPKKSGNPGITTEETRASTKMKDVQVNPEPTIAQTDLETDPGLLATRNLNPSLAPVASTRQQQASDAKFSLFSQSYSTSASESNQAI